MQTDHLARKYQFAVQQFLFVERNDGIAAVGDDSGLSGDNWSLLLCVAQRFLRTILFETGAAVQQPIGVGKFFHVFIVAQVGMRSLKVVIFTS